ncbi:sugar phosphate isomerase/epimerase [Streptomyces sp. RB6PN25]|uniref:Sugar phosphate isomerase/epimerase n=1 Tax=Streptomyces humicola TaxID=2953240 RepID=A0ABT1PWC6_9ACTN|nr:sugar phosphate isomerase/epimerase family protein [Streptomyces humicola]MCQ4080872.1 sugar phosphate isomerase/epimerase [Streptomyces humicola]
MSLPELSLNQATTRPYALPETAAALVESGIGWIGLWVDPIQELGVGPTRALLAESGLSVSSLCRVGFVADKQGADLRTALDDTRRALELAHELGALQLTFMAGALPAWDRDLRAAEHRVRDALEKLAPEAQSAGVRLALEPLHPLFVNSRSAVTTVAQALRVIEPLPHDAVGLLVDAYAVSWDSELRTSLQAAGPRIAGFQVSDFALPLPLPENMNGRLLPGDGELDLARLTADVVDAGYLGPVEVEVFNDAVWALPLKEIVTRTRSGFDAAVTHRLTLAQKKETGA